MSSLTTAWTELQEADPAIARLVETRMLDRVAYLSTVRRDGSPRVHPVTVRRQDNVLFVRMYPTSPKVADLQRDPRFALHSQIDDVSGTGGEVSGTGGEVFLAGMALRVDNESWIATALQRLTDPNPERYVVFALDIAEAKVTLYGAGEVTRRRWQRDPSKREPRGSIQEPTRATPSTGRTPRVEQSPEASDG